MVLEDGPVASTGGRLRRIWTSFRIPNGIAKHVVKAISQKTDMLFSICSISFSCNPSTPAKTPSVSECRSPLDDAINIRKLKGILDSNKNQTYSPKLSMTSAVAQWT